MNRISTEVLRDAIHQVRELRADVELFASGEVKSLNFVGTVVSDDDLATVALFSQLQRLYLGATRVTDAGMKHLEGLRSLEYVSLHGTEVTAECMNQLRTLLSSCMVCPRGEQAASTSPEFSEPPSQQIATAVVLKDDESGQRASLQQEILRRIQSLESEVVALRLLIEQSINE